MDDMDTRLYVDMREKYAFRIDYEKRVPDAFVRKHICNSAGSNEFCSMGGNTQDGGRAIIIFTTQIVADALPEVIEAKYKDEHFFFHVYSLNVKLLSDALNDIVCKFAISKDNLLTIHEMTTTAETQIIAYRERHRAKDKAMLSKLRELQRTIASKNSALSEDAERKNREDVTARQREDLKRLNEANESLEAELQQYRLLEVQWQKEKEEMKNRQAALKKAYAVEIQSTKEQLQKERLAATNMTKQVSGLNRQNMELQQEVEALKEQTAVSTSKSSTSSSSTGKKSKKKKKKKKQPSSEVSMKNELQDQEELIKSLTETNANLFQRLCDFESFMEKLISVMVGSVEALSPRTKLAVKKDAQKYILARFEAIQIATSSIMMESALRKIVDEIDDCKRGPQNTNMTLLNMPEVLGYLSTRRQKTAAKESMNADLFFNLSKMSSMFHGVMGNPALWTEKQVGNGVENIGTIPLLVLQHHLSYCDERYSLMDFVIREYSIPIATLFKVATDLVVEEKKTSQLWNNGKKKWDPMVVAIQKKLFQRIDDFRNVVRITKMDLLAPIRKDAENLLMMRHVRPRVKKVITRYIHETLLHTDGEFLGIPHAGPETHLKLHQTLKYFAKRVAQHGVTDELEEETRDLMDNIGFDQEEIKKMMKGTKNMLANPRVAVLAPWCDRTDFLFIGLQEDQILKLLKGEVLKECTEFTEKKIDSVMKETERLFYGFYA